jgi:transcriptional regulator with XRE-family HTH domain
MVVVTTTTLVPEWTFTDRLRKARESAGMNQEQLAAELFASRAALASWEQGRHRPSELQLRRIADVCGVPVAWLRDGAIEEYRRRRSPPLQTAA